MAMFEGLVPSTEGLNAAAENETISAFDYMMSIIAQGNKDEAVMKNMAIIEDKRQLSLLSETIKKYPESVKGLLAFANAKNELTTISKMYRTGGIPSCESLSNTEVSAEAIAVNLDALNDSISTEGLIDWAKRNRGWATFLYWLVGGAIIEGIFKGIFGTAANMLMRSGNLPGAVGVGLVGMAGSFTAVIASTIAVWKWLGKKDGKQFHGDTELNIIKHADIEKLKKAMEDIGTYMISTPYESIPKDANGLVSFKQLLSKNGKSLFANSFIVSVDENGKLISSGELPSASHGTAVSHGYSESSASQLASYVEEAKKMLEGKAKDITLGTAKIDDKLEEVKNDANMNKDQKEVMIEAYTLVQHNMSIAMDAYMKIVHLVVATGKELEKAYN